MEKTIESAEVKTAMKPSEQSLQASMKNVSFSDMVKASKVQSNLLFRLERAVVAAHGLMDAGVSMDEVMGLVKQA